MNHIGIFEGIGGFSEAARWMGWKTIAWCEWNPFCQKILKYYFPNAKAHTDIRDTDFTIYRGQCDILTGGFPCQPYSHAGKRKGKEDDRHLWPEMLRAIREVRPTYVVGENVSGFLNWNKGVVFDEVLSDLENEGYETQSFVLPACGLNAPHKRDRLWIIAYSGLQRSPLSIQQRRQDPTKNINPNRENEGRITANSKCKGLQGDERLRINNEEAGERGKCAFGTTAEFLNGRTWQKFPTQSPVFAGNDGLSSRLDGITVSSWRRESTKAAGNAIVPQIAYQIFQAIEETDHKMGQYKANT